MPRELSPGKQKIQFLTAPNFSPSLSFLQINGTLARRDFLITKPAFPLALGIALEAPLCSIPESVAKVPRNKLIRCSTRMTAPSENPPHEEESSGEEMGGDSPGPGCIIQFPGKSGDERSRSFFSGLLISLPLGAKSFSGPLAREMRTLGRKLRRF